MEVQSASYQLKRRPLWAVFICLAFFGLVPVAAANAAANSCQALFKVEKPAANPFKKFRPVLASPPNITVFKFSGVNSFHQAVSASYSFDGKAFDMDGGIRQLVKHGYREDESVIAELQSYPLDKMTETGYLTREEAKMFKNLGSGLYPGQVNFFEVNRKVTREELKQYPDELLHSRISSQHHQDYFDNSTRVRTATLWSVGGQVVDPKTRKRKPVPLPWEKEEARKGQELDRNKYKHVWEWGRAAQDIPDEIGKLYSANAAMNYIELMAHGGKLDDAYVMFHSFDKVNTRLYLAEHPNSTYPVGWKNPNDSLFIVPLKDMLKKYPPSLFSSRVANIVKLSGGKISEIEALNLLINSRRFRWEEFDLEGHQHQVNPIIISDASTGWILNLGYTLQKYGLNDYQTHQLMEYVIRFGPTLQTHNTNNKYANAVDSLLTAHTYRDHAAVEISNLDPMVAKRDQNYVVTVLFDAYINYLSRLSQSIHAAYPHLTRQQANQPAIDHLVHHKIKFGISSADEAVIKQAKALRPVVERKQPATQTDGPPDRETVERHPYYYKDAHMFMFSMDQILALSRAHTEYFMNAPYRLQPNYWWSQYFLSQADLL